MNELSSTSKKSVSLKEVLQLAYQNLNGSKGSVWTGLLFLMLWGVGISIVATAAMALFASVIKSQLLIVTMIKVCFAIAIALFSLYIFTTYLGRLLIIGVLRCRQEHVSWSSTLPYKKRWKPLAVLSLIQFGIGCIGPIMLLATKNTAILVPVTIIAQTLPILLVPFFYMSAPFILDKNFSALEAIKQSFQFALSHYFKIIIIIIVPMIAIFLSYIPLALVTAIFHHNVMLSIIGMILTAPLCIIAIIYAYPYTILCIGTLSYKLIGEQSDERTHN